MKRFSTCALASLALLIAPIQAQDDGRAPLRRLTPAQMEEDLFALTEELTSQHGGLLRYTTQDELDEAFGKALYEASEERSALEFFRIVSELVAGLHCGHTNVRIGPLDARPVLARRGMLPFEVWLRGERAFVARVLVKGLALEPGEEILAIDGRPLAEIRARAFSRMSADGFIEIGKQRELERDFARLFGLLVDELDHGPFRLELEGRSLDVPGLAPRAHGAARERRPSRPVMDLELFGEPSIGWLRISTFGDPGGRQPTFPESLATSFERLREAGTRNLVLDLRGNGGGEDMYGALVVSYLSPVEFRYFDHIEVTEAYAGPGETLSSEGKRLMLSHAGLDVQQPQELRFLGEVYVLTDGWTFSTAADVATVAHHNGLATFVGEETGGGYDGNTSGVSDSIGLPHSGLRIGVPRWRYTTANVGHEHVGRGVPPDHHVPGTIEDALEGRDPQLEFVRRLVSER